MNSFSIMPYEHQSILDTYKQWLARDLYQNYYFYNLNDPNFLQKLSILQAEGIRHDIGVHAAVTHGSIQEASAQVEMKMRSVASLIASSLDNGFSMMNSRMIEVNSNLWNINRGIGRVVEGVNTLNNNMMAGMDALNRNMTIGMAALSRNISQVASVIQYQLQQSEVVLKQILDELRIPESQRERRYHIEEGMKYFNKGMKSGDCLYFEDALDEFTTAISIERKDFFSWYYIGMIYLYSKEHINPEKALSAFERYIHYADALSQKHNLFDEAWMMKAECKYLMQDMDTAFEYVEKVMNGSEKAALRGMKYLSASSDNYKQQQAVVILKQLMKENPYIVMQILEDYDLVSNKYIIDFLNGYRTKTIKEINHQILLCETGMEALKNYPLTYYKEVFDELNTLRAKVQNKIKTMGVVDIVLIQEKLSAIPEKIKKQNRKAELKSHGLVDLGLPSGTLWKVKNETGGDKGFFSMNDAIIRFEDKLPTAEQFKELRRYCKWSWTGDGYKVIGSNGNSIVLPASGVTDSNGSVRYGGIDGYYWSSTINLGNRSLLYFNLGEVYIGFKYIGQYSLSVRLVQNK